jgi:hypothetical protein
VRKITAACARLVAVSARATAMPGSRSEPPRKSSSTISPNVTSRFRAAACLPIEATPPLTSSLRPSMDIRWADALAFGSPTRFGNISAQLKQFLDSTGPLWAAGELANKVATGFTSAGNLHGGNESTLLALYNTLHHWGAIVVAPGYTDPSITRAGGNPYGTAHASAGGLPGSDVLAPASYQGRRLAAIAESLAGGEFVDRVAA